MKIEITWSFSHDFCVYLTNVSFQALCWALEVGKTKQRNKQKQCANEDGETVLLSTV